MVLARIKVGPCIRDLQVLDRSGEPIFRGGNSKHDFLAIRGLGLRLPLRVVPLYEILTGIFI